MRGAQAVKPGRLAVDIADGLKTLKRLLQNGDGGLCGCFVALIALQARGVSFRGADADIGAGFRRTELGDADPKFPRDRTRVEAADFDSKHARDWRDDGDILRAVGA